jgi:hypothetical protein
MGCRVKPGNDETVPVERTLAVTKEADRKKKW